MASRKAKFGYYGTQLSDNMIETPDKYLVCKNAVIARTGFQEYRGIDLQDTEAEDLLNGGVDPNAMYRVLRTPEEVFRQATIDSFNGKIFTLTHPDELLNIDSVAEHDCGHILNVRKGDEALPSGDWPLLADIMVTDKVTKEKILEDRLRELSCGYNYHVSKLGDNLIQVEIIGNHVALVENGRAGKYAAIQDSAQIQYSGFKRWLETANVQQLAHILR